MDPPTEPVPCAGMLAPPGAATWGWLLLSGPVLPAVRLVGMAAVPRATSVAACAAACAMLSGGLSGASMTDTDRLEGLVGLKLYTDWPAGKVVGGGGSEGPW